MKQKPYPLGFTAVGLMPLELQEVAKSYLSHSKDWEKTTQMILENNPLQKNTKATILRKYRELKKRCQNLTEDELTTLAAGSHTKLLAYLSVVKSYPIVYEFVTEVLRNKYLSFDRFFYESDWRNFLEMKKEQYDILAAKSDSTLRKIRQVILSIMKETGILEDTIIERPYLPVEFTQLVCQDNPQWLAAFLWSDTDIATTCKGMP